MSKRDPKDKIYEELKGYFPPEYDLTPDELEKEIEIENKKREIALGMMKTHLSRNTNGEDPKAPAETATRVNAEPAEPMAAEPQQNKEYMFVDEGESLPPEILAEVSDFDEAVNNDTYDVDFSELDAFFGLNGEEISLDSAINEAEEEEDITAELIENTLAENFEEAVLDEDDIEFSELDYTSLTNEFPVISMPDISKLNKITEDDVMNETEEKNIDALEDEDISEYSAAFDESDAEKPQSAGEDSGRKAVNWIFDFLEIFAVCITCIIIVFASFFRLTQVSGDSMQNTLLDKEYLVVSDFMYTPKVGDIVVLQNTALEHAQLKGPLVKRVIAVGGQKVSISAEGIVTVTEADGTQHVLPQPFVKPEPYTESACEYNVPEGYIFVMGDNRNHSTDSRSSLVGVVDERCVFGKAMMRLLPFDKFTFFENPYEK
ncbi:MAG: signal peptidase I [Clostridia bacterium]|nr:signal peptidase I [Clostridia bacterium]